MLEGVDTGVEALCVQVKGHLALHYYLIEAIIITMSLVQIAYNSLLTRLRDWNRLEGKERL